MKYKQRFVYNELTDAVEDTKEQATQPQESCYEEYFKDESSEYPGFVFFNSQVIKFYKITNDQLTKLCQPSGTFKERKEFLDSTQDNGNFFYAVRDRYLQSTELNRLVQEKQTLELYFEEVIPQLLTQQQLSTFENMKEDLKIYVESTKKTYNVNKKFYQSKAILQTLDESTGINISNYVSVLYNLPTLLLKKTKSKIKGTVDALNNLEFDNKVLELQNTNSQLSQEQTELSKVPYYKRQVFQFVNGPGTQQSTEFVQEQKYFKKWSLLKTEEKLERLQSFARYYILNQYYKKKLTEEIVVNTQETIDDFYNFLKDKHEQKILKYKMLKWNTVSGQIEYIRNLKLDIDKSQNKICFSLQQSETAPVNYFKSLSKRKISSSRSIIDIKNEQQINEFMMYYLVQKIKNNFTTEELLQESQIQDFFNKLKTKLQIVKYYKKDKETITQLYTRMLGIIYDEVAEPEEN